MGEPQDTSVSVSVSISVPVSHIGARTRGCSGLSIGLLSRASCETTRALQLGIQSVDRERKVQGTSPLYRPPRGTGMYSYVSVARPCPDKMYPYQLNLDDLLDAAISILPSDAYALCMMVDDDLYEDEEDTFVCGRAYGGSRVAVVSSARYNPVLDAAQSVEREHAWPASHCKSYLEASCTKAGSTRKRRKVSSFSSSSSSSSSSSESNHHHHHHHHHHKSAPLEAALAAFSSSHETDTPMHLNASPALLSKLWLARICRTVSHELGHCFGIDYCVYYACACLMQGSASLSEDARQPPCLCPVDLAKLLFVTGMTVEARYQALLEFCEKVGIRELAHFAAYAAWLRASLAVTGSGCLY